MKKVLLVEDDRWFAENIVRTIATDYKVVHVTNPLDAIDRLDGDDFDYIILDVMLTVANALSLMQELQSHDDLSKIPIIVCTTLASDITIDQLKQFNVVALLDKTTMVPGDVLSVLSAEGGAS